MHPRPGMELQSHILFGLGCKLNALIKSTPFQLNNPQADFSGDSHLLAFFFSKKMAGQTNSNQEPRPCTMQESKWIWRIASFKKIESFICSHNRLPSNYFIIATSLRKIFVLIVQNRKKEQFIFFRTAHVHRSYGCHWVLIKERRSVMQLNGLKRIAHPNHMSTT